MRLFWRKRKAKPVLVRRCDSCERPATAVWGLGDGREWVRCNEHALSPREWTAIKELDSEVNGYTSRDNIDVTFFGGPPSFLSVGKRDQ